MNFFRGLNKEQWTALVRTSRLRWSGDVDLDPDLRDYFGNPAPRIYVSSGQYEDDGMKAAWDMQRRILEAHGAKAVSPGGRGPDPGFWSHQSGTCRMGTDPKRSALNAFNQMHEVKNVFVVDGSAFPTATEKNPTLTILALSWRATDHLAEEIKRGNL